MNVDPVSPANSSTDGQFTAEQNQQLYKAVLENVLSGEAVTSLISDPTLKYIEKMREERKRINNGG